MALLQYHNLSEAEPGTLLQHVFDGIRSFRDYLRRTRDHLKRDEAILRLAWRNIPKPSSSASGNAPSRSRQREDAGPWIELVEPVDNPSEPDSTFRAFLEDDTNEVYEFEPSADAGPQVPLKMNLRFSKEHRIQVLDRDPKNSRLQLAREPKTSCLLLRPNTYAIERQLDALGSLRDSPELEHVPLLRLFAERNGVEWPAFSGQRIEVHEWHMLGEIREGTEEQRSFVEKALNTPDFSLLEGPPGSGKTITLCELILQLVSRGKRVLLCASTHVAVDNALERLMDPKLKAATEHLLSVRIGDRKNVSDRVAHRQVEQVVSTERHHVQKFLENQAQQTDAQRALLEAIKPSAQLAFQDLVVSSANLVCGTTIGILQHPEFKKRREVGQGFFPQFDFLILDEASKTTFQEFLVPAMLAKRWVIVGDPKQLSPYVDEDAIVANLKACLPDVGLREACLTSFLQQYPAKGSKAQDEPLTWEGEVGWRLVRSHELRLTPGLARQSLEEQIRALMPPQDTEDLREQLDLVRRVGFPSVLECLLRGFDANQAERHRNTLTDGFTEPERSRRHVLLSFQHRMHPDIAAFSRTHVYEEKALKDPADMASRRIFRYRENQPRAVCLDVQGTLEAGNRNPKEAGVVVEEVFRFAQWANSSEPSENRRNKEEFWSIAVLPFYRGQEREIRELLRHRTGQFGAYRNFRLPPAVEVELCTVDRFQGHEADVVFLSFANTHPTNFLLSLNRLNVALTRARFYRVIVGDRKGLSRSRESLLCKLMNSEGWERRIVPSKVQAAVASKPAPRLRQQNCARSKSPPLNPGGEVFDIDITELHGDEQPKWHKKGGRP